MYIHTYIHILKIYDITTVPAPSHTISPHMLLYIYTHTLAAPKKKDFLRICAWVTIAAPNLSESHPPIGRTSDPRNGPIKL